MTTKIDKALSLGKIQGAKKLLEEYYLAEDKSQWFATKQEEYDVLYKTVEVQVDEVLDDEGNVITEASSYFDYVEDCISFTDWLNETRVISEAVEATYDEEGAELTPYQPEVTEQVRPYVANDVTGLVDSYIYPTLVEQWKEERKKLVDEIEVTYKEVIYQGDETSQTRMSRAINALPDDTTTIIWYSKDNSGNELTRVDLKVILLAAGTYQSSIWNEGRP